jgi:hypothetical protein
MELNLNLKWNIKKILKLTIILLIGINSEHLYAKKKLIKKKITYRTAFGKCPSRSAGTFTLQLIKAFEQGESLKDVKTKIIKDNLNEKYFISSYNISYDPLRRFIKFSFECPEPLMKVQLYKENGMESYEAILVENGKLVDPTYEILLRSENKIDNELPFLALPIKEMNEDIKVEIANLVKGMTPEFRKNLSEVIINEKKDLTIILSINNRPSSVFMGKKNWNDKTKKLLKIVGYMTKKKRIPKVINLTNSKKVVVKFNE